MQASEGDKRIAEAIREKRRRAVRKSTIALGGPVDASPARWFSEWIYVGESDYVEVEPFVFRPGRFEAFNPCHLPGPWSFEDALNARAEQERRKHPRQVQIMKAKYRRARKGES